MRHLCRVLLLAALAGFPLSTTVGCSDDGSANPVPPRAEAGAEGGGEAGTGEGGSAPEGGAADAGSPPDAGSPFEASADAPPE